MKEKAGGAVRTMADIARLAGVSTSTVSRALSSHPSIPEVTRERIVAIARAHDYRVNLRARNLRLKRSYTVAAVFPQGEKSRRLMSDPFYLEIMGAISDELSLHGYDLLISRAQGTEEAWISRYVLDKRADGLLVLERDVEGVGVAILEEAGVPFVVWGPTLPGQRYPSVGGDSVRGAILAVRHLAGLGRRRIGFVGGDRTMIETTLRHRGYREGLNEAGFDYDATRVVDTDYTPEQARRAVETLVARCPDLDALLFCSDLMAVVALETLRRLGRRVPDDVAVVGYDDIPLASHCVPALTTVRQEIYEGGRLMVRKLLALLAGEGATAEMLPIALKVRASTRVG